MLQRSSESTHIIWSMLFVAGALFVSYILAFDQGYFLLGFGEVVEVAAEENTEITQNAEESVQDTPDDAIDLGQQTVGQQLVFEKENSDEVTSLTESLVVDESVVSLSEALQSESSIGEGTQMGFEAPDPVFTDDGKQFFSVQQLFAQSDDDTTIQQGVLALQNTYERNNNGKFLVANRIGIADRVEYILKDQWNTHYVYLGDYTPGVFDELAQGAAVVAIEDKISINRSGFFGDSLWLFSIAEYEARQKIIALVRFEAQEDTRLFQIDRDRFENGGSEMLQDSFAEYYSL